MTRSKMLTVVSAIFGTSIFLFPTMAEATLPYRIHDHTDDKKFVVELSHRVKQHQERIETKKIPASQGSSNGKISSNQSKQQSSKNNQTNQSPTIPTRTTTCIRGDSDILSPLYGTYPCEVPIDEEPAPPAAQTPTGPAAQAPVVYEPVEIVITSTQLAELIPDTPQILMDRGHFGLKNAHTNFYVSSHQPQTMTQTMFGQQVTITATPIEYRWDYGDGTTLATHLPGYPTDDFNLQTDTSHRYSDSGPYTVNLTTVFEGTYQVDGGPPQAVSSPVTQQADPVDIQIWRAVTRNVAQSCLEDPTAWGC